MNKRRASRELALITLSQLGKTVPKVEDIDIIKIIEKSALALSSEAENTLNSAVQELVKIREFVQKYENEHPENLEKPCEETVPVGIPLSSDMLGRIDMVLDAADKTYSAVDLIKLVTLEMTDEVKEYAVKLIKTFLDKHEQIDAEIKEHSKGWNVERLIRIDRDIIRIAIIEILYFDDVPVGVSANEAVEIAKKYSIDESSKFINGILGKVIRSIAAQQKTKNV